MSFGDIIDKLIADIIAPIVPILVAFALLIFVWGAGQFILSSGNAEKSASGKKFMLWGVIALFVMTSVWGLVRFLTNTFRDVIPESTEVVNIDSLHRDFRKL